MLSMKQRKYLSTHKPTSTKKYTIPETSLNQTVSEDQQKANIYTSDQKSLQEKYLNIYESIKKIENSQLIQKYQKTVSHIKRSALKPKGIFQNSLIQKSYPKLPNQQTFINHPDTHTKIVDNLKNNDLYGQYEREKTIPSKKNEITLKLITEHKVCLDQKQNSQINQVEMLISGNQLIEGSTNQTLMNFEPERNSISLRKTKQQSEVLTSKKYYPVPFSYWQTNTFMGSNVSKTYTGYYKAKNKKKHEKERQKLTRNSTTFIKKIDQSIDNQKYRQLVTRPKTSHMKKCSPYKQVDLSFVAQHTNQSCEFGNHQKMIRTQSQARLRNFQKDSSPKKDKKMNYFGLMRKKSNSPNNVGFLLNGKQTQILRKNYKKYSFNASKMYQVSRNYSSHQLGMAHQDSNLKMGVTTETAYKQSIETPTSNDQSTGFQYQNNYLQSKKMIQSQYLRKGTSNSRVIHNRTGSNHSSGSIKRVAKTYQLTLNKIQNTIQNDLQLRIHQINSPLMC